MQVEIVLNNTPSASARYVGWAPAPARVRMTDDTGVTSPSARVTLSSTDTAGAGAVSFLPGVSSTTSPKRTINLIVRRDGSSTSFAVVGRRASAEDGDVQIEATSATDPVGTFPLMVRVRKNANRLSTRERDRFIAALAKLNDRGMGRFADFRNMHTSAGSPEAHGAPAFLPWHRAYLLDLERELQAIDRSVSLPYWRFDQPAPNVFVRDFMGESDSLGVVQWAASNPLQFWVTDAMLGVTRRPFFNVVTSNPSVLNEAGTLGLGAAYAAFRSMEGNPHGSTHTSFGGSISSVPTAARDPLFFLLHCNVDRLWAKWQRQNARFDKAVAASYDSGGPGGNRIGHNLGDTMWPWNGVTGAPRPPTAPGGTLATSPGISAPGLSPLVSQMLDYQGRVAATGRLAFDYDDVAYP